MMPNNPQYNDGHLRRALWKLFASACRSGNEQAFSALYSECLGVGIPIPLLDACIGDKGNSYEMYPSGLLP